MVVYELYASHKTTGEFITYGIYKDKDRAERLADNLERRYPYTYMFNIANHKVR